MREERRMNKGASLRSWCFATRLDRQGADTSRGPISALPKNPIGARRPVASGASHLSFERLRGEIPAAAPVEPLLQSGVPCGCPPLAEAGSEPSLSG